jgi:streptogramin lyase
VVTTVAGLAGATGSADGSISVARFNKPKGVAVDASGNLYVADTLNNTIRKISGGTVTTIAGLAGSWGNTDGTNSTARFASPYRIIADGTGGLFVADYDSWRIRRLTPSGTNWVVVTYAGKTFGTRDGYANNNSSYPARFENLEGMSLDGQGNLYVADTWANTIRKVSNEGTNSWVSTLGGVAEIHGCLDGSLALFFQPEGVAVDPAGNLYIADTQNHVIRKGTLSLPAPTMQISIIPGKIVLSWPLTATGYVAEACQSLGSGWQSLSNATATGTAWVITNDLVGTSGFYRLRGP